MRHRSRSTPKGRGTKLGVRLGNAKAAAESLPLVHTKTGNCWATAVIYQCKPCASHLLYNPACGTCHDHNQPRGLCKICLPCRRCEAE